MSRMLTKRPVRRGESKGMSALDGRCTVGMLPVPAELLITVIRLLLIALRVSMARRSVVRRDAPLPVPSNFQRWPRHDSEVLMAGQRKRVQYYVSPKALFAIQPASFPVGTTLVVEMGGAHEADTAGGGEPERDGVHWRFVMTKCASVTEPSRCDREIWIHACYGPDGEQLPVLQRMGSLCGI